MWLQVLHPWRLRSPVEGQRGCLWVKLHEGKNLSIWGPTYGYRGAHAAYADPYDSYVRLRLASEDQETNNTERLERTKIVTNQKNPRCV
jgi:hypothetical protein